MLETQPASFSELARAAWSGAAPETPARPAREGAYQAQQSRVADAPLQRADLVSITLQDVQSLDDEVCIRFQSCSQVGSRSTGDNGGLRHRCIRIAGKQRIVVCGAGRLNFRRRPAPLPAAPCGCYQGVELLFLSCGQRRGPGIRKRAVQPGQMIHG